MHKLLSKGTRVRYSHPAGDKYEEGLVGTVVRDDGAACGVLVSFDTLKHGHDGSTATSRSGRDRSHWWCLGEYIKPIGIPRYRRVFAPQAQTVLKHLREVGSISPMEALMVHSIYRLAAVIHDLRCAGHDVVTELRKDSKGKTYARYSLA